MSQCQEVSSCHCTPSWQSIMRKVTWRHFDQSAKQLVVGQTTTTNACVLWRRHYSSHQQCYPQCLCNVNPTLQKSTQFIKYGNQGTYYALTSDVETSNKNTLYLFLLNWMANPDIGCKARFVSVSSINTCPFLREKVPEISTPLPFAAGSQTWTANKAENPNV